jgi:polyphosphate kinase 2 (PPK2 family)
MGKKNLDWRGSPSDALRVNPGFSIADFDCASTPGFTGDEYHAARLMESRGKELSDLQERLFAEGRSEGTRSVLLVIQGMDTAGKGGIVRHVIGLVDPQGGGEGARLHVAHRQRPSHARIHRSL